MDISQEKTFKQAQDLILDNRVNEIDFIKILESALDQNPDRSTLHKILHLAHFSNVSKHIVEKNKVDKWLKLLVEILKKSRFHTGYLLKQRAEYYGDKTAFNVINDGNIQKISYSSFWSLIKNTARALFILNKKVDYPVIGLLTHNQFHGVLVDLACLSFGIKIVPIPLNTTLEHISYIISHSGINSLFIGNKECLQKWIEIKDKHDINIILLKELNEQIENIIRWDDFLKLGDKSIDFDSDALLDKVNMLATQTIMYTSGTTANPKGIIFNQINIISKRFARALALPKLSSEDKFLCYLPLFHTFGRYFELMGSIFWGASYSFAESPAFNSLINDFKLIKPTIFISIPKRWVQLHDMVKTKLDLDSDDQTIIKNEIENITGGSLVLGLSAAGYLDPDIFNFFHKNGINLLSGYGMTEATGGITMTPENDYRKNSVGTALPGIELKLEDDGELCLKGPYITEGYYKDNDTKLFKSGWFYTEDIFRKEDGHFYIIDRKKDIYKNSRGQTISPQKIENLFQDFDTIKSVFLVGDGKEFNTILIYPNNDNLFTDNNQTNINKIREIFNSMIISVNSFLSPYERIINYVIINRDFSKKNGELTTKGTYVRKMILKNFGDVIEPLYEKSYISLYHNEKEVRVPTWLLREIGILKSNLNWDGYSFTISHEHKSLSINWSSDNLQIGNFYYSIKSKLLDLDLFIQNPVLWLGNYEFANFTGPSIFRLKESKNYDNIMIIGKKNETSVTKEDTLFKVDTELYKIHKSVILYLKNDIKFFKELISTVDDSIGNWSIIIIETYMHFNEHSLPSFRIKLIEAIAPLLSGELFINLLHNAYLYLRKIDSSKGFSFDIKRTKDEHYQAIISYIQKSKKHIDTATLDEQEFIKALLLLIADFGIIHPTRFLWARSELINWQLGKVPKPLYSTAQKAYYNLIRGFRSWIGQSTNITVDPETGKEYGWEDILMFDDGVRQDHKKKLLNAIIETSLIRESIFLFSKNYLIGLSDIPLNGIYISSISNYENKSAFRLLVKTRNYGNHNLVVNLNEGWNRDFIETEVKLLIKMGSGLNDNPLVENFGGYWPEHNLYTEEYIHGETLEKYLKRNMDDISDHSKVDRWQMRWLHFIWSGVQAYQEFWYRTNYELAINPPSTHNLMIPHRDYKTGTRIISISSRKSVESLADHFISFYTKYIIDTEQKYAGLSHMSDWEVIFTATIQALKVENGKKVLEDLKINIKSSDIQKKCSSIGLTEERIDKFLGEIDKFGVLTKPVVFAALRYERWLELNQKATLQAKASILQDLYKDYELDNLLDEYPETRLRFFMMTCFRDCKKELTNEFQNMIKEMRENMLSPWNMQERISSIGLVINLNEEEKFFLARMLFPHVNSADYVELVTTTYGEESKINLVYQTECNDGNLYRIRPPFLPKEIAQFHGILKESMLSVTFTSKHEFLLAFNGRNSLVGGLYWKKVNDLIHLEWVAIKRKYQKISLSKRIMADFDKRMKASGVKTITVGFYAQEFFKKHGFKIEKQYGGMVKKL